MVKNNMEQDILKVLYSEEELRERVLEMGAELFEEYKDKRPMFVGVLNGCFIFMADLVRATGLMSEVEFISVSSYQGGTKSTGVVQITRDLQKDITDRDIIVVEDILDSGVTLSYLIELLKTRKPNSIRLCTLFDKPERHKVDIKPDYVGCVVPNEFIVGYGLDYAEIYRNYPEIAVLKPSVYQED